VVSGLARGIDAFAHHGAVDAGGRSIAVMGRGLDDVYPPENKALADKVLEHGAWISELPIRAEVRAGNFPGRNRIIAGLTLGTLVVEAAARSGALITARLASEYNREVFAVPGRVQDAMSIGTNALIRDSGAKLVTGLDDILAELGDVGRVFAGPTDEQANAAGSPAPDSGAHAPAAEPGPLFAVTANTSATSLTATERRVLAVLPNEPVLADVVIRAAELPVGDVLAALTALQLKGLAQRWPGNLVARRRVLA
jgi:DNA processing protein